MHAMFSLLNPKRIAHSEDLGVNENIISELIVGKQG